MTDVSRRPKILPYSPENYPKPLPTFANDEELRDFWDTHDVTYYLDEMEEVAFEDLPEPMQRLMELGPHPSTPQDPNSEPYDTLVLRLPTKVIEFVVQMAKEQKMTHRILLRDWIQERADQERALRGTNGKRTA